MAHAGRLSRVALPVSVDLAAPVPARLHIAALIRNWTLAVHCERALCAGRAGAMRGHRYRDLVLGHAVRRKFCGGEVAGGERRRGKECKGVASDASAQTERHRSP